MPKVPGVQVPVTRSAPEIVEENYVPPALRPQPSQEALAATSLAQQNVTVRAEGQATTPALPPTPSERSERAKAAAEARWSARYNWVEAPLDDALAYLAELRIEVERGGLTLQQRISELKVEKVACYGCGKEINITTGGFAGVRTRNNFLTGQPESAYACTAACWLKLTREFIHPVAVRS